MRIIAGQWRSRRLSRPDTPDTRPVPDRVRESIFNILGARYETPGELPPLLVADVFAGSGSLGLEALSRGAAHCSFFERAKPTIQTLRENIAELHAEHLATICPGDAWRHPLLTAEQRPFDLIFLDPPYSDTRTTDAASHLAKYLARFETAPPHPSLLVIHHEVHISIPNESLAGWTTIDQRRIGSGALTFLSR